MRETKDQTILRLKRRVAELEDELKTSKSQARAYKKEYRRFNDSRLEYYNLGLYCGKDHYNFINPWFLTLNINPHTGAKLNVGGTTSILNIIKDNPYYQQKIEAVKPYLDAADDEDPEALSFIDSIGRDIYEKLYPDFPFEEYSI